MDVAFFLFFPFPYASFTSFASLFTTDTAHLGYEQLEVCFAPGCFRLNICHPKSHAGPPGASCGTQIDAVAAQWRYPETYPGITLKTAVGSLKFEFFKM